MPPFCQNIGSKFLSEPIFKMASLLPHVVVQYQILSQSRFGANVTFLQDYDVIIGDSLPKLGKPP